MNLLSLVQFSLVADFHHYLDLIFLEGFQKHLLHDVFVQEIALTFLYTNFWVVQHTHNFQLWLLSKFHPKVKSSFLLVSLREVKDQVLDLVDRRTFFFFVFSFFRKK